MPNALTVEAISPGRVQGVKRAQREPAGRFHALAPLIDVPALTRAYHRQRADAAVGVDGVTKEQDGQSLEANLQEYTSPLATEGQQHLVLAGVTSQAEKAMSEDAPLQIGVKFTLHIGG